ncbi:secreted protein [gut metagenome]|uniref:Secreted protein n=1 Tax=gut metagenome TaxID=749906 RepID=J9GIN3_9ZZZZ
MSQRSPICSLPPRSSSASSLSLTLSSPVPAQAALRPATLVL